MAWQWDDDGIVVWWFPRSKIPQDIIDYQPDPSTWPEPVASFPNTSECDVADEFFDHHLIINIALCGDWAGEAYSSSGCPGTCAEAVADPQNFQSMFPTFDMFCWALSLTNSSLCSCTMETQLRCNLFTGLRISHSILSDNASRHNLFFKFDDHLSIRTCHLHTAWKYTIRRSHTIDDEFAFDSRTTTTRHDNT